MNSEELEQSLRTEFENYLKNTVAEMKQEVSEFQQKIESDFEQHKSNIDKSFQEFSEKFGDGKQIEDSFVDSVSEHLKLARDEGSKITAAAFEEAEQLKDDEPQEDSAQFIDIRDAINEISSKDSQSEILKSLVRHSTQFTPRGAFFIVKNEHLVGWRMFGTEEHDNPQVVREVFFPVSSKTNLSQAVETLGTVEGSSEENEDGLLYLNKLGFETPEQMCAIPLVARGRGVAVLYADNGTEGGSVNVEALETLMRVAGLTVEVLASTQAPKAQPSEEKSSYTEVKEQVQEQEVQEQEEAPQATEEYAEVETVTSPATDYGFQTVEDTSEPVVEEVAEDSVPTYEDSSWEQPVAEESQEVTAPEAVEEEEYSIPTYETSYDTDVEEVEEVEEPVSATEDYSQTYDFETSDVEDTVPTVEDYQAEVNQPYEETSEVESSQFENFEDASVDTSVEDTTSDYSVETEDAAESTYDFETSDESGFETAETEDFSQDVSVEEEVEVAEEPQETVAAPPVRTRFGDRNVDLPIEVAEDERRLHNDARRFARLLVSEIKLYNEQKVKEGRESSDLYERLREAIDRSREMYDKRVQPPVAAKFDYFNYELINTLAEGDEGKLGGSYPGATV